MQRSIASRNFDKCKNCGGLAIQVEKSMTCTGCKVARKVGPFDEPYVAFDIIEQIQRLSYQIVLDEPGQSDSLTIKLQIACDSIPLSGSSSTNLVPVLLFIRNIENTPLRNKHFIIASVFISRKKSVDYKTLFNPLIKQIGGKHPISIVTNWSATTYLVVDSFLADSPCRAAILNHLSHSGNYPCHRCTATATSIQVDGKGKRKVALITRSEMFLKTKDYYQNCIAKIGGTTTSYEGNLKM